MSGDAVELAVAGATIVGPAGRIDATLWIDGGRVVAVGGPERAHGLRIDARGLLLLPGFVDTHVHLMEQADPAREDWAHGTAAAAGSGVTTIVEHTHGAPVRDAAELGTKRAWLDGRSHVDYSLAAHAWPDRIDAVEELWRGGVAFLKVFTCTTHGVPGFEEDSLRALFAEVARAGAVCLVHAEDEASIDEAEARLRASGRTDGGILPAWRTRDAELTAVERVLRLAAEMRARVVIAHASQPEVVERVAAAEAIGTYASAETCPQYLTLFEDEVESQGALRKFTPPARARKQADLDAMWAAVADGRVRHLSSDHAPSTLEQKQAGSIWDVHFGLPGLDTTSAVLIDGALTGRLSLERLAEVYAAAPARVYGLRTKGRLEPGADADFVLIDPAATRTISNAGVRSKAGWTPYEGREMRGRVVATYLRGEPIFRDELVEAGTRGQFVTRSWVPI